MLGDMVPIEELYLAQLLHSTDDFVSWMGLRLEMQWQALCEHQNLGTLELLDRRHITYSRSLGNVTCSSYR